VDDENHTTDVWQGTLEEDEDPRNIYFDHPIDESDMCIFPVLDFVLMDVAMTGETRNCPAGIEDDDDEAEAEDDHSDAEAINDNESSAAASVTVAAAGVSVLLSFATLLLAAMAAF